MAVCYLSRPHSAVLTALEVACSFWRVPNTLRIEQRKECEHNIFNTFYTKNKTSRRDQNQKIIKWSQCKFRKTEESPNQSTEIRIELRLDCFACRFKLETCGLSRVRLILDVHRRKVNIWYFEKFPKDAKK